MLFKSRDGQTVFKEKPSQSRRESNQVLALFVFNELKLKIKNMKKLDDLAKRMKDYEIRTRTSLPRRSNVIIRIDGKAFHTYTRGLEKPFDIGLMEDMAETTKYLCSKIQGAKFGYTQSDEISLVLTDYDTLKTDMWFDGQIQKIVSVAASMATAKFNQLRMLRALGTIDMDVNDVGQTGYDQFIYDTLQETQLAEFDARAYSVPDQEEVVNYLIWRQQDATRNSISMAAQANFSHTALQGKSTNEMQDMLMTQKEINWNDYAIPIKRGWAILRAEQDWVRANNNKDFKPYLLTDGDSCIPNGAEIFTRSMWMIDSDMPILTKDRNYVLKVLPTR